MPLTPIDIQQKTFGPELRGYNMDEVDDFLDEVVGTLKDYDQRIRDAQDRIRALEAEVATRGEDETAISRALVAAQKQADSVLEDAHQEAERIRSEAFDEADTLRSERDTERMSLTQEMARMRATVADLKRRVLELAASAGADLDAMDSAIADATDAVAESISPEVPAASSLPGIEDEDPFAEGDDALDEWGRTSEERGEHQAAGWEEEVSVEEEPEPEWETPVGESAQPDTYEHYGQEEDEDLGDLADEMANEASASPSDDLEEDDDSSQPSRRPWERGSV
jgi:cell division initiation protein